MSATSPALRWSGLDEPALRALASRLAALCRTGDCLLLEGEPGAGKTAFATSFISTLVRGAVVTSPTFAIAQSYGGDSTGAPLIWHYDLYRIEHASELEELHLQESVDTAITLIEWPQIADAILPTNALHISIAFGHSAQYRDAQIRGDDLWMQRLQPMLRPVLQN